MSIQYYLGIVLLQYSGWTLTNKDQYYPAEVDIKSQKRNETIVKFKRELIIA